MVFSSPIFLFAFLPLTIVGYFLMPRRFRNFFLLLASYGFYAYSSFGFLAILIGSSIFDYVVSRLFFKSSNKVLRRGAFFFAVISNLLLLAYFKYANFFVEEFGWIFGVSGMAKVVLPLGISFFTFQKISYLVDFYREVRAFRLRKSDIVRKTSFIDYALYIALFPQLIAGPIVRFDQISEQLRKRKESFDMFFDGVYRFVLGLSMKVLVADILGAVHLNSLEFSSGGLIIFIGILAYSFQIYFDFAGYSNMAIGLGKMFGFEFPENFNRPYLSRSITEFWRRWHMTLSGFLKEYVYFPLGGSRVKKWRHAFNLIFVFFLTGIWHGANYTFFIWGIYFGFIIVVEKFFLLKFLTKIPVIFSRIYNFVLVFFGWILFQAESLGSAINTVREIFSGFGDLTLYSMNFKVIVVFFVAFFVSFFDFDFSKFEKSDIKKSIFIFVMLSLCILNIAGSTYHPFLYFRF